jgi:uncharacterized protein (DUF2235 family)
MPKKLVLCSDGTGNSSAKAEKTNVWRIFQALDQTEPDQLAYYDDGVGTSSNKYLAALGGAFGYGLKRNVIDLYKFVCRVWQPGDEIYGFGFSRGAYTIRMVIALIESQGLAQGRSESELHAHALAAYRRYRNETYPSWSPIVWVGRRLRDLMLLPSTLAGNRHLEALPAERRGVPIRFLGLWDTVAAYGMPVDELKWGISLLIWPMTAADHHLSEKVQRACHALSLDDERQTFHPILFDETHEAKLVAAGTVAAGRLTQVWFSGAHSNVGGGYSEDQQSLVTLDWMISQARDVGLRLDARAVQAVAEDKSPFARLYDARKGAGSYYRYAPRRVVMGGDSAGKPIRAIVHGSVIARIAYGSDAYAPISLPSEFDVLAPDGSLLPMVGFAGRDMKLPVSTTALASVVSRTEKLRQAIQKIGPPLQGMVEQIRDTVWWRRVTYFAFLGVTLALAVFPAVATQFAAWTFGLLRWVNDKLGGGAEAASDGINDTLIGIVQPWQEQLLKLAPGWAASWVKAFVQRPFGMLIVIGMVAGLFLVSNFLQQRVHDRAWFAWHANRRDDYVAWVRDSAARAVKKAAVLFGGALILALACKLWDTGASANLFARLLAIVLGLVLIWRLRIRQRLGKVSDGHVPSTPTLKLARLLRNNPLLTGTAWCVSHVIVPLLFAGTLLYGVVSGVSHFVARSADSAGLFCTATASPDLLKADDGPIVLQQRFDTRSLCWATGIEVKEGTRYEIVLDASQGARWYDKGGKASVAGLDQRGWPHAAAAIIKRSWDVDYFIPMLRIGNLGNDERFIPEESTKEGSGIARLVFKASRKGELFLYVSDAILPVPFIADWFYSNNCGSAAVVVGPAPAASAASAATPSQPPTTPLPPAGEKCPRTP